MTMRYKLSAPSVVKSTIQLPASKSISNRALIINALARGTTPPCNLSDCDDTLVMIKALAENNETIDEIAAQLVYSLFQESSFNEDCRNERFCKAINTKMRVDGIA